LQTIILRQLGEKDEKVFDFVGHGGVVRGMFSHKICLDKIGLY
jgi:hypothetical protein